MKVPYAPIVYAIVTNSDDESFHTGTAVLTLKTRLTPGQMADVEQINQVTDLMMETMKEILENAG